MLKSQYFFFVSFVLTLTIYTTIIQAGNNALVGGQIGPNVKPRPGEGNNAVTNHNGNFVATDPNNIRFVLGKTQLFPIPKAEDFHTPLKSLSQNITSRHQQSESSFSNSKTSDKVPELEADVGNNGGTHQNNVNIGGIQNFGGDVKAEISKIIADKDNTGGTHQNNVAIGGILNFNK